MPASRAAGAAHSRPSPTVESVARAEWRGGRGECWARRIAVEWRQEEETIMRIRYDGHDDRRRFAVLQNGNFQHWASWEEVYGKIATIIIRNGRYFAEVPILGTPEEFHEEWERQCWLLFETDRSDWANPWVLLEDRFLKFAYPGLTLNDARAADSLDLDHRMSQRALAIIEKAVTDRRVLTSYYGWLPFEKGMNILKVFGLDRFAAIEAAALEGGDFRRIAAEQWPAYTPTEKS